MSDIYRTRAIQMETRYIEIKAMHDEKTRQLISAEKEIIYQRQLLIKFDATQKTMNSLAEENDQLQRAYTELQTTLGDVMGVLDNFEKLETELDETKHQLQNAIEIIQEKEKLNMDLENANQELGTMCEMLIQQAEENQIQGIEILELKDTVNRSRAASYALAPPTPRSRAQIKKSLTEANFHVDGPLPSLTEEAGEEEESHFDDEGFSTFRRGRANTRDIQSKLHESTEQFSRIIQRSQKKKLERQATLSNLNVRLSRHKITE